MRNVEEGRSSLLALLGLHGDSCFGACMDLGQQEIFSVRLYNCTKLGTRGSTKGELANATCMEIKNTRRFIRHSATYHYQ